MAECHRCAIMALILLFKYYQSAESATTSTPTEDQRNSQSRTQAAIHSTATETSSMLNLRSTTVTPTSRISASDIITYGKSATNEPASNTPMWYTTTTERPLTSSTITKTATTTVTSSIASLTSPLPSHSLNNTTKASIHTTIEGASTQSTAQMNTKPKNIGPIHEAKNDTVTHNTPTRPTSQLDDTTSPTPVTNLSDPETIIATAVQLTSTLPLGETSDKVESANNGKSFSITPTISTPEGKSTDPKTTSIPPTEGMTISQMVSIVPPSEGKLMISTVSTKEGSQETSVSPPIEGKTDTTTTPTISQTTGSTTSTVPFTEDNTIHPTISTGVSVGAKTTATITERVKEGTSTEMVTSTVSSYKEKTRDRMSSTISLNNEKATDSSASFYSSHGYTKESSTNHEASSSIPHGTTTLANNSPLSKQVTLFSNLAIRSTTTDMTTGIKKSSSVTLNKLLSTSHSLQTYAYSNSLIDQTLTMPKTLTTGAFSVKESGFQKTTVNPTTGKSGIYSSMPNSKNASLSTVQSTESIGMETKHAEQTLNSVSTESIALNASSLTSQITSGGITNISSTASETTVAPQKNSRSPISKLSQNIFTGVKTTYKVTTVPKLTLSTGSVSSFETTETNIDLNSKQKTMEARLTGSEAIDNGNSSSKQPLVSARTSNSQTIPNNVNVTISTHQSTLIKATETIQTNNIQTSTHSTAEVTDPETTTFNKNKDNIKSSTHSTSLATDSTQLVCFKLECTGEDCMKNLTGAKKCKTKDSGSCYITQDNNVFTAGCRKDRCELEIITSSTGTERRTNCCHTLNCNNNLELLSSSVTKLFFSNFTYFALLVVHILNYVC